LFPEHFPPGAGLMRTLVLAAFSNAFTTICLCFLCLTPPPLCNFWARLLFRELLFLFSNRFHSPPGTHNASPPFFSARWSGSPSGRPRDVIGRTSFFFPSPDSCTRAFPRDTFVSPSKLRIILIAKGETASPPELLPQGLFSVKIFVSSLFPFFSCHSASIREVLVQFPFLPPSLSCEADNPVFFFNICPLPPFPRGLP